MKLLHIADVHLDRSFEGLTVLSKSLAQRLHSANQLVLRRLVDAALQNEVDAVIFAGDTFHQSRTSIQTQTMFLEEVQRLVEKDIHVMMTFGNHDYYDRERYWFDFPEGVYLFESESVETHYFVTKGNERVAVSGFSYVSPWLESSKLSEFPLRAADADIHIGVYHGDVAAGEQSRYAPFSLSEMKSFGYDYWALGHIHQPQVLSADPLIVYPGTPQGHTKKEQGLKGAGLVTLGDQHATVHFVPVEDVRWDKAHHSLAGQTTKKDALAHLQAELTKEERSQGLTLLELHLTHTEQLGQDFVLACDNGELLAHLQSYLSDRQPQTMVHHIATGQVTTTERYLVQADPRLIKQLEDNYLQPDIFMEATKELQQHPLVSQLGLSSMAWREECVQRADQYIRQHFTIQEDLS